MPQDPAVLAEEKMQLYKKPNIFSHKKRQACSLATTIPRPIQINPTQAKQLCKSVARPQVRRSSPTDVVAREHKTTTQQRQTETQGVLQLRPLTMNTFPSCRKSCYSTRT